MTTAATTLRLESTVKEGLAAICEHRHLTLNKLVNQALEEFVAKETVVLEREMSEKIEKLRKYRHKDPDFQQAISRVVEGEVSIADDPAEGVEISSEDTGTTSRVRDILSA